MSRFHRVAAVAVLAAEYVALAAVHRACVGASVDRLAAVRARVLRAGVAFPSVAGAEDRGAPTAELRNGEEQDGEQSAVRGHELIH